MIHDWKFSCWLLLAPLDLQPSLWGLRSVHTARAKDIGEQSHDGSVCLAHRLHLVLFATRVALELNV